MAKMTIPQLQDMKSDGRKIFGVVVWDYQMARIADDVGADILSVGDSVGHNLWGQVNPLEVSVDQMMVVTQAVRRGTQRALLSVDLPYGVIQDSIENTVRTAIRFVKEAGVDLIKLDGAADYPDSTAALVRAGIPVWAQFGVTPQTAMALGIPYSAMNSPKALVSEKARKRLIDDARMLEATGASLLDFTNSGPVVGPEVVASVDIPVIGGFGGGPWLDGRVRMANAAIGYEAGNAFLEIDNYANVAKVAHSALSELQKDVRSGRQIKTGKLKQ